MTRNEPEGRETQPEPADRVKAALAGILALEVEKRVTAVALLSKGDPGLGEEVRSLLSEAEGSAPWAEAPFVSLRPPEEALNLAVGSRVGPYRISGSLGEGGMGSVVLALREDDFKHRVALKVLRRGTVSEESIRRFREEREILAELNHPNIASILDGGETPDGHPFFALEYVDGLPIDQHLERREVSLAQRLALFLKVCAAISAAHRNLIIHRDLKPENILVTAEGEPKVLDFGIAKRLEPSPGAPELTIDNRLPMTLRYASPEQIAGDALTTASDVYSLGVILYEVLARRHPFEEKLAEPAALALAISEAEPSRPSEVAAGGRARAFRIPRDLDSIALKAMSRRPEGRYRSVDELADDIERFLEAKPVRARDATWPYRFARFARRNRAAFSGAMAATALVLAASTAVAVLWRQAVADRAQAQAARARSDEVLNFTKDVFWSAFEDLDGGPDMTARAILARAEKEIESDFDDPLLKAELLNTVGEVFVQLDMLDEALGPLEKAERILATEYPGGHPDLARAIGNRASWLFREGRFSEAEALYRRALDMRLALPMAAHCDPSLVKSMSNMASILLSRGDFEEAEVYALQALECRRENEAPESLVLARSLRTLGVLYLQLGRLDEAEPLLRKAVSIQLASPNANELRVASALSSLGRLLTTKGEYAEATEVLARVLAIRTQRLGDDHLHTALTQLDLVQLSIDSDRPEGGRSHLAQAGRTIRAAKGADSWEIARVESLEAWYMALDGKFREATAMLTRALDTLVRERGARALFVQQAEALIRDLSGLPEVAALDSVRQ